MIRDTEAWLANIVDIAHDAIIMVGQDQRVADFNKGAENIFGHAAEDVIGQPLEMLIPAANRAAHSEHIVKFGRAPDDSRLISDRGEFSGLRRDGTIFPAEASISKLRVGGETIFTVMLRDVTERKRVEKELHKNHALLEARVNDLQDREERLEAQAAEVVAIADALSVAEKKMEFFANHDALTGLPSLRLCKDRIDMAMKTARRDKSLCGLIFIDLDGFKAVNDDHGHDAGDAVLKIAAERIQSCIREVDTAARIGGDEFIIVAPGIDKPENAAVLAERLIDDISMDFTFNGATLSIGASIGIALFPTDGATSEELIQSADKAMYKVKQKGKNSYGFALSA